VSPRARLFRRNAHRFTGLTVEILHLVVQNVWTGDGYLAYEGQGKQGDEQCLQAFHDVCSCAGGIMQIIARQVLYACAFTFNLHTFTPSRSMGPLSDIKVLELGTLIAGPFCSRIFAEFGAQVIKIESPAAVIRLRQWRKLHNGTSLWWYLQARNKKSVTVNMREPEGQEIVRKLAAGADIVIETSARARSRNGGWVGTSCRSLPGLVMVRLSGYGQTGRTAAARASARSARRWGTRYVTGYPDRAPVRVGISLGCGRVALRVIGALMALRHREVSGGRGQVVDVALYRRYSA